MLCVSTVRVYQLESEKRLLNEDQVELSLVKYGIFSVDIWKGHLTTIVINRVNEFNFDDMDESEVRARIVEFLNLTVDKLEESFYRVNQGSIGGFMKGRVASFTDVFGTMKEDIPLLTESIVSFIKDSDNKAMVKEFVVDKLNQYSDSTFSEIDYTTYDMILARHGVTTKEDGIATIAAKIDHLKSLQKPFTYLIFITISLMAAITMFSNRLTPNDFLLLCISCAVLLSIGVMLPMIDIDARISSMDFHLMGESISFKDQVLYFKSKSILEVVHVMIVNGKPDVAVVGVFVLLFSVIFPVLKLTSSVLFIYSERLRNNRIVQFLIFKTAKWTMADVMVVAIFMAYIGFSGIISDQLKDLETIVTHVDMLTTNESSLQIGFFLFTGFAILSLLVSHKLHYSYGKNVHESV